MNMSCYERYWSRPEVAEEGAWLGFEDELVLGCAWGSFVRRSLPQSTSLVC